MARLFADTYALIELLKGNPSYEKYSQLYEIILYKEPIGLPQL